MSSEALTPDEELSLVETISEMIIPLSISFSDIAFDDPLRPRFCAQLLHGVWFRMFVSDDEGALPAAFEFIVFDRTDSQMKSLLDGMSRCRCAPDDQHDQLWIETFHEIGAEALSETANMSSTRPGAPSPLTHFHSLMSIISVRILQTLGKTNPVKLAKQKGRQEWPASLDDIILPSIGPETTVKSLEQWIRQMTFRNPWPIKLLGSIASVCRSLIFPAILKSPTLIPTILRLTGEACDDATPVLSSGSSKAKLTETVRNLFWRLETVASFFRDVFLTAGGGPGMLDNFPVARKTAIVQTCARVIELLRSPLVMQHAPDDEDRLGLSRAFTGNLTLFLDVGVDTEGIDPALVQQAIDSLEHMHGPSLPILPDVLLGWKQSLRCYAMSCDESLQTSGTFKRCSSCTVVSYCGTACQRRAWRDHKPVCKTIVKVIKDGGGDLHSPKFREKCVAGKVAARDADVIVNAFSTWRRTHGGVNV
ncbi:hypothetical protein C8R47DRAFT_1208776 [Mycena vitilis]|nr:hypothetical protein C8R47DRAFT_1208776 [Mycena vitilis]